MASASRLQNHAARVQHYHNSSPAASASLIQQFLVALVAVAVVIMEPLQQTAATDVTVRMGNRRKTNPIRSRTNYIVSFADMEVSPGKRCAELANSTEGTVDHVYDHVLNGCSLIFSGVQAQSTFTALKSNPIVNVVVEDQEVSIADLVVATNNVFDTAPRLVAPSWGLDRINQCALPLDNAVTKQDATGAQVFIVDTGIYAEHEDFANGMIGNDDCHFSAFPGETALSDSHGHG